MMSMTAGYTVYLNGYYFSSLASADVFGDRPEPYRQQEKSLWTIYQLLQLGAHEVTITDTAKQPVLRTRTAADFSAWLQQTYPDFAAQLDQPVYTKFPHSQDYL
ncbi:hypothetical protein [Hymenobacter negativus]|uniref:Uncharacterized protein n=1 Tax=Hymenobacter negativus TaxID=2795026 RepID=A0ABS3QGH2_9BACT|nr:hypothetical protein [Hymenobacter negativus]MBO2010346.1 hypothetical protein [Hymenobacter negativus]